MHERRDALTGAALPPWLCAVLLACLGCALTPALAAEDKPAPRDAAEVVQEGDVSRWLEHYQRERGADWARQQRAEETKPADQGPGAASDSVPAR